MSLLFIEATRFTERIQQLRAESHLWGLEDLLCQNPEKGSVIQRNRGVQENSYGAAGAWETWRMPSDLYAHEIGLTNLFCLLVSEE